MARTPVTVKGGEVKTPLGDAPILPVLGLMIGGYLAWFGIHYWRRDVKWPTDPIKSVLTGSGLPPSGTAPVATTAVLTAEVQALQPDTGGGSGGGTQTGSGAGSDTGLAGIASSYKGQGYVWGGNASAPGDWDCSSFSSFCLHKAGFPLPGGKWSDPGFPPNSHGPTTLNYLLYGTPINRADVGPGDLIVWNTHMGIAVSGTNMVSARDTASGTGEDPFDGFIKNETAHYRRPPGGGHISTAGPH